jgi:hypothetical protein
VYRYTVQRKQVSGEQPPVAARMSTTGRPMPSRKGTMPPERGRPDTALSAVVPDDETLGAWRPGQSRGPDYGVRNDPETSRSFTATRIAGRDMNVPANQPTENDFP